MVQSNSLTLSFSSESSIEEELKRESTTDAITIVVRFSSAFIVLLYEIVLID